jgi:hypothetical protein
VPQGSILGPLLFLVYINDLPYGFENCGKFVLYADDTSVLVTANNNIELKLQLHFTLNKISNWFTVNGLLLNMEKMSIVKFSTNYLQEDAMQIIHQNTLMDSQEIIKSLGLKIHKYINWKNHIEEILPKLSCAFYDIRSVYHTSSISTLKMICFAYFNSKLEYGIIFCRNSTDSKRVFQLQKKIIRIMTGSNARATCRPLFDSLGILF